MLCSIASILAIWKYENEKINYFLFSFWRKVKPSEISWLQYYTNVRLHQKLLQQAFSCTMTFDEILQCILNTYPLESVSPQLYWVMRTFQLLLVVVVPPMLKRAVWQVFPVRSASTITKKNTKSFIFHDNFLALFQNYFWTMINNLRKTRSSDSVPL